MAQSLLWGSQIAVEKKSDEIRSAKQVEEKSQFSHLKNVIVYLAGWIKCTRMNIQNINTGLDGDLKA